MISITCTNENPREMLACATMFQQLVDLGIVAAPAGEQVTGVAVQTVVDAAVGAVSGAAPDPAVVFGGNAQAAPPPPPAPAATAPTASPVATSPTAQTGMTGSPPPPPASLQSIAQSPVDSKGYTWDERIHAKAKTTIADGSFKLKKGVDKALVAQILPTLFRGVATAAVAPASATGAPPPPPVTTAIPASNSDPVDVGGLMNWVVKLTAEQRLDIPTVTSLIEQSGIPGLHLISEHPDKVATVVANIKRHLGLA